LRGGFKPASSFSTVKFNASFLSSFAAMTTLPADGRIEVALIGRSNVGKSSLINALAAKKGMARVSATPGKTRLLNFYLFSEQRGRGSTVIKPAVAEGFYLVDMPGFGYAKVAKTARIEWANLAEKYFLEREQLASVGLLVDARHPGLESDLDVARWFGEHQVPFFIVLTKADKAGQKELAEHRKILGESAAGKILSASAVTGKGIEELRRFIQEIAVATRD
jgi:GTP-binding protein